MIKTYLAYGAAIYLGGSIYYLLQTKLSDVETPFNDSLTPKQKQIKNRSASVRRNIFYQGLGLSSGLLAFAKYRNLF